MAWLSATLGNCDLFTQLLPEVLISGCQGLWESLYEGLSEEAAAVLKLGSFPRECAAMLVCGSGAQGFEECGRDSVARTVVCDCWALF